MLNTESTITIKPFLFQVGKINEFVVDFSCIFEGSGWRAQQIYVNLRHTFCAPILIILLHCSQNISCFWASAWKTSKIRGCISFLRSSRQRPSFLNRVPYPKRWYSSCTRLRSHYKRTLGMTCRNKKCRGTWVIYLCRISRTPRRSCRAAHGAKHLP